MEALIISPMLLALLFFIVALIYSSVGLGGGSSYTALLAIFGANPLAIPSISLSLNVIVTSIASTNFLRSGHVRTRLILPFVITSIPMAYVGGAVELPRKVFYLLLMASLSVVAVRIYAPMKTTLAVVLSSRQQIIISVLIGALLGFIAGAVGIGGGIYLIPIIILFNLGTAKEAAAAGAIFIWVNSFVGIIGRYVSNRLEFDYSIPIILAVIAGGFLGSQLGSSRLSPRTMEKLLGVIIVLAIVLLARKLWGS